LSGLAIQALWSLLGTTSYGYWLVPTVGAGFGWCRTKDRWSKKALINAFLDSLAAVIIVFVGVFLYEFCWNVPHQIKRNSASTPPPPVVLTSIPPSSGWEPPIHLKVRNHQPAPPIPQADPRTELVKEARDMAQKLVNLDVQIKADVDENHRRRDENIQTDLYGLNGVPRFHTEQEKNNTIRFENESWAPEEIEIRVNGVKIYRNCCQDAAIKIRGQLIVCAPKVSSYEQMDNYKMPVEEKVDLNLSPISAAGFNLSNYWYAAADLKKLADACEAKIKPQ
jgi:hypothetical protein